MYLHREGRGILLGLFTVLSLIVFSLFYFTNPLGGYIASAVALILFLLVAQFFRVPRRTVSVEDGQVLCPADGKVVVIEEVEESEYFNDKRIQISVFMSPLNVHVQWAPIPGKVKLAKYHEGLFLVAWHPKSSTDNERTTLVIEGEKHEVLFRQIAGAVARRIRYYIKEDQQIAKGEEVGFIKFGSRVDIFLPLGSEVKVGIDEKVTGRKTVLAVLPE